MGGIPFTNGPLGHLLRNRVYLGEITHKGTTYEGEHEPILDWRSRRLRRKASNSA